MTEPHIAILFEFPSVNGGEESMLAVLNNLANESFRFTALAPESGLLADRLRAAAIPIVPFSVRSSKGIKREPQTLHSRLTQILTDIQPDILHANSLSMSRLTGQLNTTTDSVQLRRTGHLRDIIRLSKAAIADINRNHGLVAVSKATREFHITQGLNPDTCDVLYNGVALTRFTSAADDCQTFAFENETGSAKSKHASRENARRVLLPDIPGDSRILLNVGQICLRKGQLNLARSVCDVITAKPDVQLVLAGERHSTKQESRDYEQSIRDEFASRNMADRLHMIGYQKDIPTLMRCADALVHAAHQEPFGRTLLEAAACKLPIVATNVGGTAEMLRHNQDALLVSPEDVSDTTSAILQTLDDPDGAAHRAESAHARVVRYFSVETTAAQTAIFWKSQLTQT